MSAEGKPKCRTRSEQNTAMLRLIQHPKHWNQIPCRTGKKVLNLPKILPDPQLPFWEQVDNRTRLPLPDWGRWNLTIGKLSEGYVPRWEGALFDLTDINNYENGFQKYCALTDPALWRFCGNRKEHLVKHGLITPEGDVKVTLKQLNKWRAMLFRYQHQLVQRKYAMARRNETCALIKGFMQAINGEPTGQQEFAETNTNLIDALENAMESIRAALEKEGVTPTAESAEKLTSDLKAVREILDGGLGETSENDGSVNQELGLLNEALTRAESRLSGEAQAA